MSGLRITDAKEISRLISKGLIKDHTTTEKYLKATKKIQKQDVGFCLIPPKEPAHVLYQAIVGEFGRLYDGGDAVFELSFPHFKRKYRADTALPAYRVVIELDGWQYHGRTLSGFQRDREKSLEFERRGWRVIRFSNKQVKHELIDVIAAIRDVVSHCDYRPELKAKVKPVAFDRSVFLG